jgi:hypothetical protein
MSAVARDANAQGVVIPVVRVPNVVTPKLLRNDIGLLSLVLIGKQPLQKRQRILLRVLLQLLVPESLKLKILRSHAGRLPYLNAHHLGSREASLA